MTTSEYSTLADLIGEAFDDLGGRALVRDVVDKVRAGLPADMADYLVTAGLSKQVGLYFRRVNGQGLPTAPCVDDAGTHVQQELLTLDDLKFLFTKHMQAGKANYQRAAAYAAEAKARFDVLIDKPVPATG